MVLGQVFMTRLIKNKKKHKRVSLSLIMRETPLSQYRPINRFITGFQTGSLGCLLLVLNKKIISFFYVWPIDATPVFTNPTMQRFLHFSSLRWRPGSVARLQSLKPGARAPVRTLVQPDVVGGRLLSELWPLLVVSAWGLKPVSPAVS